MAVQLILKNSAVQDKEATAAQLAAGELALNYHSSGPFLQCEDTAGNIWRLGGVVIASTAPSNPSKGAWWLDSDDNSLSFYDGSSWISIQTGETAPGDITEGTARQLLQTNAAGNGTEWTSNIDVPGTLDVTGVATFDNNVVITGNLTVNGTTTTIDTTTLVVEDKNIEMGAVGTPTDSTADGGGITLKGATDKTINWVNATDAWTSSERFSVPLGAQGTPSLTFTGDPNTGIYSPGADQVAISTGGTGRLFVDANGNVGVGAASPAGVNGKALTVYASDYPRLRLINDATGTASGDGAALFMNSDDLYVSNEESGGQILFRTAAAERLRIDPSGRVGVGTSSPTGYIHIEGISTGTETYGRFTTGPANGDQSLVIKSGSSRDHMAIQVSTNAGATDDLVLQPDGGNVGVGTTSPGRALEIGTSQPAIKFNNGTNAWTIGTGAFIDGSDSFCFFDEGVGERMRIDSSGRVGIGTSSPNDKLEVAGAILTTAPLVSHQTSMGVFEFNSNVTSIRSYGATAGTGQLAFKVGGGGGSGDSTAMRIDANGRVGIGTTSPTALLNLRDAAPALRLTADANDITELQFGDTGDTVRGNIVFHNGTGGNALAFHTNNNNEAVRIDSSGRLLVGTSTARDGFYNGSNSAALQVEGSGDAGRASILRSDANGALILGYTPTASNGNSLGVVSYQGNDGGGFVEAAHIRCEVDGTPGADDMPGRLVFSTTADGAFTPTERVRIESGGKTKFSGGAYGIERTITPSLFNLHEGNFWTCGAIAIPNPQNQVAGFMGSIRVTAAPTSFGSHFDFPGGTYTAPTSFPAVAPFFVQASGTILVGSWTEGIA